MEVVNLLQNQPELFGTYKQFLSDCDNGLLPDYSFVGPNYNDHESDEGEEVASDQHPDHDGGFPVVTLRYAWGGPEGQHTIANMDTSLLGGSSRPPSY